MSDFNLIMISAGFEHGGNVTHRHFDGHPDLLVYPFESQLGNRNFTDFLTSVERVQYRYPEFPEEVSALAVYEQIIDEELKTFLRKRNGSKFRDVDLILDETKRVNLFSKYLGSVPFTRKRIIEAFFRATFAAWENYYATPRDNMFYVGYSPAIVIDADRMIRDFPNIKIIHVVRNPFSAYRDTKRRPFPQTLNRYLITWNIYHSTGEMFSKMYPNNIIMVRYEDLVENKRKFMESITSFLKIPFHETLLYPSWNGKEIVDSIAPWGTVLESTREYNRIIIEELSEEEKFQISVATTALARHFKYNEIDYLEHYYAE
jgi:hypothetical protein